MASCFGCLKLVIWGDRLRAPPPVHNEQPAVKIDTTNLGANVVVVKQGRRVCGTGGALANAAVMQNKAYFEAKLQSSGQWSIGLARQTCNLNVPLGSSPSGDSWVLSSGGWLLHNGTRRQVQVTAKTTSGDSVPPAEDANRMDVVEEGEVIGVTYDHEELCFFVNGKKLSETLSGLRGTLYPAFYVDDGAILDINFSSFAHQPPPGFEQIMIEKSLL